MAALTYPVIGCCGSTHTGAVAQLGERGLCKPEVVGSIPIGSTMGLDGSACNVYKVSIRLRVSALGMFFDN